MANNYSPKQRRQKINIGIWNGLTSLSDHMAPPGFLKNAERWRYVADGLKTTLGWEVIDKGLAEASYNYPSASGGWDYNVAGGFVDYVQNENGKVIVFEGYALCDTDDGEQFAEATTTAISLPVSGGSEFRGCLYFAGDFLIYTDTKLFEVTMATGALTSQCVFATDIGSEYSPVSKMYTRFGSIWGVTATDRVFWSDTLLYKVATGSQVEDQGIDPTLVLQWQTLATSILISVDDVEYQSTLEWDLQWILASGVPGFPTAYLYAAVGTNYFYVVGTNSTDFSSGDVITLKDLAASESLTVASYDYVTVPLAADPVVGNSYIDVEAYSAEYNSFMFRVGDYIEISEGVLSPETKEIIAISNVAGARRLTFSTLDPLNIDYTIAATVTHKSTLKMVTTGNLVNSYYATPKVSRDEWISMTEDVDYNISLDPANDPDAEGNIKLLNTALVRDATAIRVTYTPGSNPWQSGNAGWVDVDEARGNTIASVEGAGKEEVEGSFRLYIFKDSGDIYSIIGKPGVGGTPGSLDIEFIASSLRVRPGSIQTTKDGVIFGVLMGVEYNVYFIPHGTRWAEEVPQINAKYQFETTIPFDDDDYTIKEWSGIMNGNTYVICFPSILTADIGTANAPLTNGFMYTCDIFKDRNTGRIRGAWLKLPESIVPEYNDPLPESEVADEGAPISAGMYYHYGTLLRVYYYRTGYDYNESTRYYEICRYGWRDGEEECKGRYAVTVRNGFNNYQTTYIEELYEAKLETGMINIADRVNVRAFHFQCDTVGGNPGDAINLKYDIYKDLSSTSIFAAPKEIDRLTDHFSRQKILSELKTNFTCKYFKLELMFDNIIYQDHPAYVLIKNLEVEVAVLSSEGLINEERNTKY